MACAAPGRNAKNATPFGNGHDNAGIGINSTRRSSYAAPCEISPCVAVIWTGLSSELWRKIRARRYETAHGLAMDITVQRFLDNEPVVPPAEPVLTPAETCSAKIKSPYCG